MGLVKVVVFWVSFLMLFATSKALVTLAVASCDDSVLDESQFDDMQTCFQLPEYNPPKLKFDTDLSFDPDFVSFNNTNLNDCAWFNVFCHGANAATGMLGLIAVGVFNFVILLTEMFLWVINVQLITVNILSTIISTLVFIFKLQLFLFSLIFTFIPGAPWYVNAIFVFPFIAGGLTVAVKIILTIVHGE